MKESKEKIVIKFFRFKKQYILIIILNLSCQISRKNESTY